MSWAWIRTLANFELPGFQPVEVAILDAWNEALDPRQRIPFGQWRSAINYVQRVEGGLEIDFYCFRSGRPYRSPDWQIPGYPEDGVVHKIEVSHMSGAVIVDLTAVKGGAFSIESKQPLMSLKGPFSCRIIN